MSPREHTERILRALATERQKRGRGEVSLIDRKLGHNPGYLSRVLNGQLDLRVEQLFEILSAMDVAPEEFFTTVIETGYKWRPDRVLSRLEKRAEGSHLLGRIEKIWRESPSVEVSGSEALRLRGRLIQLDELRFTNPARAIEDVQTTLESVTDYVETSQSSAELLCEGLGVWGSICRAQGSFPASARCLLLGYKMARDLGLPTAEADLLLRTCYLIGDQGEYETAARTAEQACRIYTLLHDLTGIGKSLVDRGVMLNRQGEVREAIHSYEAALQYLPEAEWVYRTSALQGLGASHMYVGRLVEASEYVRLAAESHPDRDSFSWWRLCWLQGEIDLEKGDLQCAERAFTSVRDAFVRAGNDYDVAVISLRLSKALLMGGKVKEMLEIASQMMRLLQPLQGHKIACAVINEFICAALAGEVTSDSLDRAGQKLQRAINLKTTANELS